MSICHVILRNSFVDWATTPILVYSTKEKAENALVELNKNKDEYTDYSIVEWPIDPAPIDPDN